MKVTPIDNPVAGEWLLDVNPVMAPNTESGWARRLNYFTGRNLSHVALIAEQQGRSGRQALTGQGVSRGVVSGFEVRKSLDGKQFLISPGAGIALSGEDVVVPRSLHIDVVDIQVYAPVGILNGSGETPSPGSEVLLARELGPRLGELINDGIEVNRVGILVLQAVAVDMKGFGDDRDPCDEDPSNDAFENWQTADAFRLVYYAWPSDYLTLPAPSIVDTTVTRKNWQNRIAYQIFEKEKTASHHPWDELGVAIALVGFDDAWNISFVDRHAVARQGGKPRYNKLINNSYGSPYLWQARVQQFNAQVTELSYIHSSAQEFADEAARQAYFKETTQEISESFRSLPPVGMLPKQSLNFDTWESYFFQSNYQVEVVAVPLEQLDVVLEAAASLEPFHVNETDRVRIVVPVPQVWYEPNLLITEAENPAFQNAIDKFSASRALLLDRRHEVREKVSSLTKELTGEEKVYPDPDPDALEENESDWRFLTLGAAPTGWSEIEFDDSDWLLSPPTTISSTSLFSRKRVDIENLDKFSANIAIDIFADCRIFVNGNLSIGPVTISSSTTGLFILDGIDDLIEGENVIAVELFNINNVNTPLNIQLVWHKLENNFGTNGSAPYVSQSIEDLANWLFDSGLAQSLIETQVYDADGNPSPKDSASIVSELREKIREHGLDQYIVDLQAAVDSADDTVNLKFLKIQTDIYRLRQLMLGNDDSSRLSTSPILASIAQGETALGTKENLANFYEKLKFDAGIVKRSSSLGSADISFAAKSSTTGSDVKFNTPPKMNMIDVSAGGINFEVTPPSIPLGGIVSDTEDTKIVSQNLLFQTNEIAPTYNWIFQQQAIIGWIPEIRTTTVAERLKSPASVEAKNAAVATKYETIKEILALGIFVENVRVPGFVHVERDDDGKIVKITELYKSFKEIIEEKLLGTILAGDHDIVNIDQSKKDGTVELTDADEAAYYSAGVRALENASSMLRLIEARINSYRTVITKCLEYKTEINDYINRANRRLSSLAVDIAESRYDVSVAKTLLGEELARVAAVNKRRKGILAKHVPYLSFFRPRVVDSLQDTPVHPLNPAFTETPVPLCLGSKIELPEELGAMVEVLRDSPIKWFIVADAILKRLNTQNQQNNVLNYSIGKINQSQSIPMFNTYVGLGGNQIANTLYQSLSSMHQTVSAKRQAVATLDFSVVRQQSWKRKKATVKDSVSLRDLIDGNHGNTTVVNELGQLLKDIASITGCLYQSFSQTPAKVRLEWAERLSQYDEPVNLRNLSSLPRWGEIEYLDRKRMQSYVDWLHNQIDSGDNSARDVINDVIRICLLLSSHSPVNKIISGIVKNSKTVKVGDYFDVMIKPDAVYVGMEVFVYQQSKPMLTAVVDDFSSGEVSARVISTALPSVTLQQGAKTHFSHPGMMKQNPVMGKKAYYV